MSRNKGWIKLYRQIQESALWDDGKPFDNAHAWIDLLLCVNHADREKMIAGEIVTIRQGEMFTSDKFLANRWHWSRNRVRRFLEVIERNNMVMINRTANGTWLNIVNYAKFQGQRTANGTGNGTTDGTSNGTSDGTQYKNVNNTNNFNNERGRSPRSYSPPTFEEVKNYCKENNYRIDIPVFMAYYAARDWELSRGKKMTNWKSAVDAWHFRSSANRREEERHGVGLASTGLSEEEQKQALIRSEQISEIKQEPAGPGHGSKFKGGAAAELRRRQRKA